MLGLRFGITNVLSLVHEARAGALLLLNGREATSVRLNKAADPHGVQSLSKRVEVLVQDGEGVAG